MAASMPAAVVDLLVASQGYCDCAAPPLLGGAACVAAPEDGIVPEAALHDHRRDGHLGAIPRQPTTRQRLHVRRGEHLQLQFRARAREAARKGGVHACATVQ